jgi:hypothetical protein
VDRRKALPDLKRVAQSNDPLRPAKNNIAKRRPDE